MKQSLIPNIRYNKNLASSFLRTAAPATYIERLLYLMVFIIHRVYLFGESSDRVTLAVTMSAVFQILEETADISQNKPLTF